MSDRPTISHICIGGLLRARTLGSLYDAAVADGAGSSWDRPLGCGQAGFRQFVEEPGRQYLVLVRTAEDSGFPKIEAWCRENKVPFDRFSEAKVGYDPELHRFRAEGERVHSCNSVGDVMVEAEELQKVLKLAKARDNRVVRLLVNLMGDDISDLPHVKITGDRDAK